MEELRENEMIVDEWIRSDTGEVFTSYDNIVASMASDDERIYHPDDFKNAFNENDDNQFDFLFNNGSIRYFIWNGYCWFIGKDICDYLEYNRANDAIKEHVSPTNTRHFSYGDICKGLAENPIGLNHPNRNSIANKGMLCLTEQGVYELTRFSRMPKADKFYEWIHNRVLPNIRQTGTYMTPNTAMTVYNNPEKIKEIIEENTRITRELDTRTRELEEANRFLKTAKEEIEFDNVSIHDLKRIIDASDSEAKRIADQATFEAQAYKREKDIAWDKVGSLQVKNSDLTQRISYLESKLSENNIAYSDTHPKVEMCRVVKPMDDIDTILSRLIKK